MKSYWNIEYGQLCQIGDKKPTNQDNVFAKTAIINDKSVGLFVVADGVGGLTRGEEISWLITEYFKKWFEKLEKDGILNVDFSAELKESIEKVNSAAFDFSRSVGERMGSTIALFLVVDEKYYIANVGDSRIYRVTGGYESQLSYDHSLVADLLRNGEISIAEAKYHPKKNVITMCIGVNETVSPYFSEGVCKKNEQFLLCSDGFYNYVERNRYIPLLKDVKTSADKQVCSFRKTIPEGNAKDNVSILLIRIKRKFKFF